MSTNVINSIPTSTPEHQPAKAKDARKFTKKATPKRASRAKKAERKSKAKRANKKIEVVDLMRRPGGATLAAIMQATGWQVGGLYRFFAELSDSLRRLCVASLRSRRVFGN